MIGLSCVLYIPLNKDILAQMNIFVILTNLRMKTYGTIIVM